MKKAHLSSPAKRAATKLAAKPAAKKLVAVRQAAQKPVHATRSDIRRAVRAVAAERPPADA
jgi:hypothetical protein